MYVINVFLHNVANGGVMLMNKFTKFFNELVEANMQAKMWSKLPRR